MKVYGILFMVALIAVALPVAAGEVTDNIGDGPVMSTPADSPGTWTRPRAVLLDTADLVTCAGCGTGGIDISELQNVTQGMGTYGYGHQFSLGYRLADQFDVPAAGWHVDQISFFAYQSGSGPPSTITGVYLQIWDGVPDGGGTVVWGDLATNRMVSSDWTNIYRTLEDDQGSTARPIMASVATVNLDLTVGTYWLDWSVDGSGSSGPWAPPITILGQTTTGAARQYTTAWVDVVDGGTGTQQGFPVIIEGVILPVELQSFSVE